MTYKVSFTIVKPEGIPWFSEFSRENRQAIARLLDWRKMHLIGPIGYSKVFLNPNTAVKIYEFENKKEFDAFLAATIAHPDGAAREVYNQENNIVTTIEEIQ